jgi:hypothetical protein
MEYTAVIILLALAQYLYFSLRVGAGRARYGVEAPHTSGNENWFCCRACCFWSVASFMPTNT